MPMDNDNKRKEPDRRPEKKPPPANNNLVWYVLAGVIGAVLALNLMRTTAPVKSDDLRLLRAFLAGKLKYDSDADSVRPIKKHLPRLRELLGLG